MALEDRQLYQFRELPQVFTIVSPSDQTRRGPLLGLQSCHHSWLHLDKGGCSISCFVGHCSGMR